MTYDLAHNIASINLPNQTRVGFTYSDRNHLLDRTTTGTQGALAYGYQRNRLGQPSNVTEPDGRAVRYRRDGLLRLIEEEVTGGSTGSPNGLVTYTHDASSNRSARQSTLPGVSEVPSYGIYSNRDWMPGDVYDHNGNTVQSQGGSIIDAYDHDNRLVVRDNGRIEMVYDGDGDRTKKTVQTGAGPVVTQYLTDDLNPTGYSQVLEELDASNNVVRRYTYGLERISQHDATGARYYGYDGQGNVRFLTDSAGAVTDTYDYDVFGSLIAQTGTTQNSYLYQGEQFDSDLGLYYLRARYYSADTGRFWTMDPFEGDLSQPEGLNKYAYANADPSANHDPTGNWSFTISGIMQEFSLLQDLRKRTQEGSSNLSAAWRSGTSGALGSMALEMIADANTQQMWVGASDGMIIGGMRGDAMVGDTIRNPARRRVPGEYYFALNSGSTSGAKVERDIENAQLAISNMGPRLYTDPQFKKKHNWLESAYHIGLLKALTIGGDPMTGQYEITIYPSYSGRGPGVEAGFGSEAKAMKFLRPKMGQSPGSGFYESDNGKYRVIGPGVPTDSWMTQFMLTGPGVALGGVLDLMGKAEDLMWLGMKMVLPTMNETDEALARSWFTWGTALIPAGGWAKGAIKGIAEMAAAGVSTAGRVGMAGARAAGRAGAAGMRAAGDAGGRALQAARAGMAVAGRSGRAAMTTTKRFFELHPRLNLGSYPLFDFNALCIMPYSLPKLGKSKSATIAELSLSKATARQRLNTNRAKNGFLLSHLFHRAGHPMAIERMIRRISRLSGSEDEIASALQEIVDSERAFLLRIHASRLKSMKRACVEEFAQVTVLNVNKPKPFRRGSVVEAVSNKPLSDLTHALEQCWVNVDDLKAELDNNIVATICVEIWPDTGRIFWIVQEKRELFRYELLIPALEIEYFKLPTDEGLQKRYEDLRLQIQRMLIASFVLPKFNINTVIIRDSDDMATDYTLLG